MAYIRDIHLPTRRPPVTIRGENVLQIESHATIDQPQPLCPCDSCPTEETEKRESNHINVGGCLANASSYQRQMLLNH